MNFETIDKTKKFNKQFTYIKNEEELIGILKNSKFSISSGSALSFAPNFLDDESILISHKKFNKIINFDIENETIEAQSGCQLYEIQNYLLDYNYMLKIHPGWPTTTIGGCIANSIHGKNPYLDGTFGDIVREIRIILPGDTMPITCSRDQENELFFNTIGGFGLTGTIISAKIKVSKINSFYFSEKTIEIDSFEKSVQYQINNAKKLAAYSWHDTIIRNKKFGRGLIFEYFDELPDKKNMIFNKKMKKILDIKKINQPVNLFNKFTYEIVNNLYRRLKLFKKNVKIDIFSYLYPMSVFPIPYWFFFNGYTGFIEHQILIPIEKYEEYFFELKRKIYKYNIQAYMSFIKLFNGKRNNLMFDGQGVALSIEFLNKKKYINFLNLLDDLNTNKGVITALYKDSRISKETVIKQYGDEYHKFVKYIKYIDPNNKIMSNFKRKFIL